tara:strand:+ start:628 stop:1227 length:600 start_codon:yes stop_codon:yes gene_type:complete
MGITSIAKKVVTKAEGIGKKVTKVVSDMGKKVVSKKEKPKVEEEEEDKTEDDYSPDAAKKRGPERHLTKNYNFAGPGTEYKARMKGSAFYEKMMKDAGRTPVGSKPYNKPYDKLDACGKKHDKVYANPKATPAQVKEADRVFQKCAQKITVKDDGITDKLRSIAARTGFEGKIALESVGVLRKGSFASGGAKKRNKRDP